MFKCAVKLFNVMLQILQLQRLTNTMATKKRKSSASNGSVITGLLEKPVQNQAHRPDLKKQELEERENLVLWKQPVVTLEYFIKEAFILICNACQT